MAALPPFPTIIAFLPFEWTSFNWENNLERIEILKNKIGMKPSIILDGVSNDWTIKSTVKG